MLTMRFGLENDMENSAEMNLVAANVLKFHSKLEEFRVSERYADVTITCEEENFKCHRVALATASEYFDARFGGRIDESTDESVVLEEVSAEIFKDVVQFIYTGDILINPSKIYSLLRATKFLKLTGLQDLCVLFIQENKISVEDTFDVFTFACASSIKPLIDVLSTDIVAQFRIFSRNEKFLEISYADLNVILDKWKSSLVRNEELLLGALIRWICHKRESRSQYVQNLFTELRFENLNPGEYTRFVFTQLLMNPDAAELTRVIKPLFGHDELPSSAMTRETSAAVLLNRKFLNVYVQFSKEDAARVFCTSNENECSISGEISLTRNNQCIRTVAVDNVRLFCLHYPRESSEYGDTHEYNQTFRLYNSVDLSSGQVELKDPPVLFKDVNLVNVRHTIYACSKSLFPSTSSATFNDEAIERGTYVYHCDLDTWMPIPAMRRKFYTCCATTRDGILYLFGDEYPYEPNTVKSSIQIRAYDYRLGVWSNLTPGNFNHNISTECCVSDNTVDDRIILHTGPRAMTSYNITAGRWEPMSNTFMMNIPVQYRRLMSYSNRIWAIGSSIKDEPSDLSFEFVEDTSAVWCIPPCDTPITVPWYTSSVFSRTAGKHLNKTTGIVLDAVVFRAP